MNTIEKQASDLNIIGKMLNEIDTTIEDKLSYAASKVAVKLSKISEKFNEQINDIEIKYCEVDDKGRIIYDNIGDKRHYIFTRENSNKKKEENVKLMETTIEVPVYLVDSYDTNSRKLPIAVKIVLEGILFKEEE